MKFNHQKFFDGVRGFLRKQDKFLTQDRVDGLEFLLTSFESDPRWSDIRCIAYALATICIETAWTFQPIQEYGSFSYFEKRYGHLTRKGRELGNDAENEGAKYSGKGYVQLTGESNYEKLEQRLRAQYPDLIADYNAKYETDFDLTEHAEQANDPQLAFAIMTIGMFQGVYTGHKFNQYITPTMTDYVGARRIINGRDHAAEIALWAKDFALILRAAMFAEAKDTEIDAAVSTIQDTQQQLKEKIENFKPGDVIGTSETLRLRDELPVELPAEPQPTIQNADTIVNTGDTAAAPVVSEPVTISAPAKDGATSTATKLTIAGITVPPFAIAAIDYAKEAVNGGYISAADIGSTIIGFIKDNQKYVFMLVGLIIGLQIVKKILKGFAFLLSMLTAAIPGWNTVQVVPFVAEEPYKRWYQFWK